MLGRPVAVSLEQIHVEAGEADAQAGQSSAETQAVATRVADAVAERAALVAGVPVGQVLVDRTAKRVAVRATALTGAPLAAYRALELRVAAASPGWRVTLIPPAAALGIVTFDGDAITPAGQTAIADAAWGSQRLGLPVGVAGPAARTETVAKALAEAGATVLSAPSGGGSTVRMNWRAPGEDNAQ